MIRNQVRLYAEWDLLVLSSRDGEALPDPHRPL